MSMSPDSSQKETTGDCHVCEQPAHGIHFGVLSCRACAAFFRRTVVCNRQYPCRRGDDRCQIQKGTRMICRKCRYNKCVQLGMTADNVQWNRDRLNHSKATPSVKTVAKEKAPEPPIDDLPRPIPRNPAQKQSWVHAIDDAAHCHIYQRLEVLFTTFDPELEFPGLWEHPSLTRMQMGLIRHRQCQNSNPEDIIILQYLNVANLKNTIESTMFRIAEWHMFSREFVMLPLKDKLVIFHDSWKAFLRMERLQMTIEVFGQRTAIEKMFLMGDNFAVRYDEVNIDLSSVSDYDGNYLRRFFDPIMESVFERIVKPLQALNLNNLEFTYLLCQLCFHVEGMDLPYSSMDCMVEYRDKISDDLHDYYMSIGQPNYAQRLIKIMGIIQAVEGVQSQKDQVMELIRIFDIIKIDGCERASKFC